MSASSLLEGLSKGRLEAGESFGQQKIESQMSDELLEFPCDFPVKAMGYATPDFEDHVVAVVSRHASLASPRQVRIKESSGGRYLSVTVSIEARSREHLELIYSELKADTRVVFIL